MRFPRYSALVAIAVAALFLLASRPAHAGDDEGKVKVYNGAPFKGTNFALGAFRVAFVTEDEVRSEHRAGMLGGGATASMSGFLEGLDHATMQRLADAIYADFLKQAAGRGLSLTDSAKLAAASLSYAALPHSTNFEENRMGTVVIPTGQTSVDLAEDGSAKANKGSKGLFDRLKQKGAGDFGSSDANKSFPAAAKEAGMPVLGVTIVVNFANFKGGSHNWGGAKAGIETGATIDGNGKEEVLRNTSIVGWAANTPGCAVCLAQDLLQGTIHSSAPVGTVEVGKTRKDREGGFAGTPTHNFASKDLFVTIDMPAYEKGVLLVAAEANAALLAELGPH